MSFVIVKSEFSLISVVASAVIAIVDATSPPACPPIPSATAINFGEINPESSFPSRCNPRSESANTLNAKDIFAFLPVHVADTE